MVNKTNRSTLHMLYNIQQSATQDSDYIHVAIVPTLGWKMTDLENDGPRSKCGK